MNNAQGSALIYQFHTGSIKEIRKDEFISFMISAGITNKLSINELLKLPYRDIIELYKDKFQKLAIGIYGFSKDIGSSIIVCLLDKTFEDFKDYCRKQGWKLENEDIKDKLICKDYVYIEKDLIQKVNNVKGLRERFFVKDLDNYLNNSAENKICAIYGLKRTGKSYGILQSIKKLLDKNIKVAYFDLDSKIDMQALYHDLEILKNNDYNYIFLDEITFVKDFMECCQRLADFYTDTNKKHIVIAGTDSYLIELTYNKVMLGRMNKISTTWVSYKEYIYIMNKRIPYKYYLQTGGTFGISEQYKKEHEEQLKDLNEDEIKYLQEAVIDNIVHSIRKATLDTETNSLRNLTDEELSKALHQLISKENEKFLLKLINETFDLTNSINILKVTNITEEQLNNIKQRFEDKIKVNIDKTFSQDNLDDLFNCLLNSHAITQYSYWKNSSTEDHYIFTQPSVRYQQIKILLNTIKEDSYISSLPINDRDNILNQLEDQIVGKIMENNIVCHLVHLAKENTNLRVRQIRRNNKQEIDMLLFDINNSFIDYYEIKLRKFKKKEVDCKWICQIGDDNISEYIKDHFGKDVRNRYVIYRGEDNPDNFNNIDMKYLNVEKYLALLNKDNVFNQR